MPNAIRPSAILLLAFVWIASPADAEVPRSGPHPGAGNEQVQKLVDELRALTEEADRNRAADPRFLRDLRGLARRYDYPWRVRLISDDFRDGDYTANPAWTAAAGQFTVAWGGGLATEVRPRTITAPMPAREPRRSRDLSGEDVAIALFGEIFRDRSGESGQSRRPAPPPEPQKVLDPAEIFLPRPITNAFAIRAVITGRPGDDLAGRGGLEIGVYRGAERNAGYRLVYTPGKGLALLGVNQWGSSVIDATRADIALLDGKDHVIEWTRTDDGHMVVRFDGAEILARTDRGWRDPFDGFHLINRGGDYLLRSLTVDGTK
ncbi:MAG: hypothetical protein IIA72_12860 [Proteobacteria bacterium]|nr:hypothetical protein [Pseudomonadota bacterium]